MNILVTGGAGYIGSHTVLQLARNTNHSIHVLDRLSRFNQEFDSKIIYGHKEVLEIIEKETGKKINFYEKDLLDFDGVLEVFKIAKPDIIIHFAALTEVGESVKYPEDYYENNILGGLNILKAMKKNGTKYIVFSSTAATFGQPIEIPIKETTSQQPINPYGKSKLMFEQILKDLDAASGIKHVILRYFNACGAELDGIIGEDHRPESHLIPLIMEAAKGKRDSIKIYGTDYDTKDGTCIRDYVHVLDLADAHIKSLEYLETNNISNDFNLGSSSGYSVKEIIDKVKSVSGIDFKVEITDRRSGDPAVLIADNTKVKEVLGWKIRYNLDEIVESAWKWEEKKGQFNY